MATYSSILAWRIPWTEEPGGLQSMGLQRVRPYRSDLAMPSYVQTVSTKQSDSPSGSFLPGLYPLW